MKLKSYSYTFEWKHGPTASMITKVEVRTPRSGEFVSCLSGPGVVVYGLTSDEPFVAPGRFSLQHLAAIVEEVKAERQRILDGDLTQCKVCRRVTEDPSEWTGVATVDEAYNLCPVCARKEEQARAAAGYR